jgi:hypothetical protein
VLGEIETHALVPRIREGPCKQQSIHM